MSRTSTEFLAAFAATAASIGLVLTWRRRSNPNKETYLVKIPISCLSKDHQESTADAEGLVSCRLNVNTGLVEPLQDDTANKNQNFAIAVPAFCDAHTHLVKSQTIPRTRNQTGTITEALLQNEVKDSNAFWNRPDDIYRRMDFSIRSALAHGTRALRTHLDGTAHDDPHIRTAVWDAFDSLQAKYRNVLHLQGVANLILPLWSDPAVAQPFCEMAIRHQGVVLGAYCGNSANASTDDETLGHLHNLFQYAIRYEMDIDLHMDESNDPKCCTLLPFCQALRNAREEQSYRGSVVLGHCCALSLQPEATQRTICQALAELNVTVVVNPFTNMGLQDRRGSSEPFSRNIPLEIPRTPQWRGITLLQELHAAGVNMVCASDNVRDFWYPYGDYDLLAVWKECQAMGHLDTAPSEGAWAHLVTLSAERAMKVPIEDPPSWVIFPQARRFSELFARPQKDRIITRNGAVQTYKLPDFHELDDLMEE